MVEEKQKLSRLTTSWCSAMLPLEVLTIDDLQLSPALTLSPDMPLQKALAEAFMRDFSILPVTDSSRSLLGYLNTKETTDSSSDSSSSSSNLTVADKMKRFQRKRPYMLLTPDTDLATLTAFFDGQDEDFAIVTDAGETACSRVCRDC